MSWDWPVPDFDSVSRGRQDCNVVGAKRQRSGVCAVATQGESRRLGACRTLLCCLYTVRLYCVILQQQSHFHLTIRRQKAVHWPEKNKLHIYLYRICECWAVQVYIIYLMLKYTDLILEEAFILASFWISSVSFRSTTISAASAPPSWDLAQKHQTSVS